MHRVTTHEAKTNLSQLISRVLEGEEIMIFRGNVPVARLVSAGAEAPRLRPPVGTVTSDPVSWSADAFSSLDEDDLRDWGL